METDLAVSVKEPPKTFSRKDKRMFDDFGIEEFGMALGLGEEIGLGEQEDHLAQDLNEPEPMSLEECQMAPQRRRYNRPRKPAPRGSFEEWVRLVIDGEIDPYDSDRYPYRSFYDDPM